MKNTILISLAAAAAIGADSVAIQKITVEAQGSKAAQTSISQDEVRFSKQSDLAEMLSSTLPEITHVRNSSVGSDIVLRGFRKDNINVTIDDAKVHGACPNRMDPPAMHVSSEQISRVEVKEGPFDVTNFGSMGGSINVVTKDPKKELGGEISATLGSFGYQKYSATLQGGNDKLQLLAGYSLEESKQYKDGDGATMSEQNRALAASATQKYSAASKDAKAYTRQNFYTKLVFAPSDNQKVTLSYFGDRARDVLYPRYPMDAQLDDTDMFSAKYQLFNLSSYSKELKIEAYQANVAHIMGTDFRNFNLAANGTPNPMGMIMTAPVDAKVSGIKAENRVDAQGMTVSYGLDGSLRNWNGTKGPKSNSKLNILLPDVDTTNIGVWAKASKQIGKYEISGGARYDATNIGADGGLAAKDATNAVFLRKMKERDYQDVSANILAKYNYTATTNVFLGLGQSIRVPDAKELYLVGSGNSDLKETKNREIDLGAEHTFAAAKIKGTLFFSDLEDYIYAHSTGFSNIDAKIYGGDLKADLMLSDELSLQAGLAYQKGVKKDPSQVKAGQSDRDLAEIPPLKGRVAALYNDSKNFAMVEMIAAGTQSYDGDNGEKAIGGYGVWNLKFGRTFGKNYAIYGGVTNIFDKTYAVNNSYVGNQLVAAMGTLPIVLNEPGRAVYANLSYKF